MRPTDVILTVDIEFTIGGAFTDPTRFKPVGADCILGKAGAMEHGLGFILKTLKRYDAKATFFVEALNTAYFGLEPMGAIARRICDAGHDVQLHIHPCWLSFSNGPYVRQPGSPPPNDDCETIGAKELLSSLRRGIEVFAAWGLPRPVALRTGNFSIGRHVYAAQRSVGIPLASSVCSAVHPSRESSLHLRSGRHVIEGIIEAPVLSFVDLPWRAADSLRPLQITAVSQAEIRMLLDRARRRGLDTVVALTHSVEFFKRRRAIPHSIRPNLVNQARLAALCAHVQSHPAKFTATTFAEKAKSWIADAGAGAGEHALSGSGWLASLRMAENAINDRVWWF